MLFFLYLCTAIIILIILKKTAGFVKVEHGHFVKWSVEVERKAQIDKIVRTLDKKKYQCLQK